MSPFLKSRSVPLHRFFRRLLSDMGLATACVVVLQTPLHAQTIEVAPFGGYRFGGDFFELLTARPIDVDGMLTLGAAVSVQLEEGTHIEALFSHQRADVSLLEFDPPGRTRVTVDHWMGGGLQELDGGRARPFLTGLIGLTRYASAVDSEVRFVVSAGGGIKVFPTWHVGLRLDGRVFATVVDADGTFYACAPGRRCLLAFDADVVWQAEFTAGVVIRLFR
jgi:hypothetical protein